MEAREVFLMIGAMVVGSVLSSFGVNASIRSSLGRSFVGRWRWWGLVLYYVAIAGAIVAWFGWVARAIGTRTDVQTILSSPWFFFGFGVVVGLPFTLATITTVWRDKRGRAAGRGTAKKPAARGDRLEFAKDLERQIREYAGESRKVHTELQGENGTVLFVAGDLSREEGERLVAALRGEMKALDFARVEGKGEKGKWWVRV